MRPSEPIPNSLHVFFFFFWGGGIFAPLHLFALVCARFLHLFPKLFRFVDGSSQARLCGVDLHEATELDMSARL